MGSSSSARMSLTNAKVLAVNSYGTCIIEIEMSPELLQRLPTPCARQTSPASDEDTIEPAASRDQQGFPGCSAATRASSRQPKFVDPAIESNVRGTTLNDRDMHELQTIRRENSVREMEMDSRGRREMVYGQRKKTGPGEGKSQTSFQPRSLGENTPES